MIRYVFCQVLKVHRRPPEKRGGRSSGHIWLCWWCGDLCR
jgi:hypothetical protein